MKTITTQGAFSQKMPNTGFLRLPQVLQFIPVSKSVWYDGVNSGLYPKPVKLSERTHGWKVSDINSLIEKLGGNHE